MVAWEIPKRLASAAIDILEVNSILIPTEIELEKVYWKELTSIVEKDENASHHSEGDEAKHDVEPRHAYHEESPRATQPPQLGFEINVADLLRAEMEKLEGRLRAVISTRLDRWRKKLTSTSAFDDATSSTAYVLENESKDGLEKEARFNDVTDVPAAERKIDLPEEDPKLEEKM
ncbi:Hypothetical predicted protein [Olea europaea subsp. europaea]|uniref:Uncharacterized protein n=1 Tax=Olea europaea subsp. europaea TaxID=158383 RepID=A0A8S0VIQ4_OLEEU|nr:Hypothetical predicted protein [Olea europaea subsp. europaea]